MPATPQPLSGDATASRERAEEKPAAQHRADPSVQQAKQSHEPRWCGEPSAPAMRPDPRLQIRCPPGDGMGDYLSPTHERTAPLEWTGGSRVARTNKRRIPLGQSCRQRTCLQSPISACTPPRTRGAVAGFVPLFRCDRAFRRSSSSGCGCSIGDTSAGRAASSSGDNDARSSINQPAAFSIPDSSARFLWYPLRRSRHVARLRDTMAASEIAQATAN
jgi:hypothetical protein